MNKTTKTLLIAVAVLLILGGIGAAVFALIQGIGNEPADSENDDTTVVLHDDTEYVYDANGNIKSELYYEDNVYVGRKDYIKSAEERKEYITEFDADMNEVFSSVTELNFAGSVIKVTSYEKTVLSQVIEYDYYDDMRTVAKKTTKNFEGEDEYAEKIYYAEAGHKTQVCKYLNGTLTEETFYDENGKVIENGGETVED